MTSSTDQPPDSRHVAARTKTNLIRLIRDIYQERQRQSQPVISVEFFPPKTAAGDTKLFDHTLPELQTFTPDFYSVTYGAGGSTRDRTLAVVDRIQREHQATTMAS